MPLSTQVEFLLSMAYTGTARDFETPANLIHYYKAITLASGTGEGQADVYWSSHRNLAGFATDTIDLTTLTGHLGTPLTFARLTGLIVVSAGPRNPGDYGYGGLEITRPVNGVPFLNAVGDRIFLVGRGMIVWFSPRGSPPGVPVTAGTGDLIQFDGGSSSATFDIHLFGTSA